MRRDDDTDEALTRRLAQFHEHTCPSRGTIEGKGLLKEVNGTADAMRSSTASITTFARRCRMIPTKRGAEIDKMRRAGEIAAEILNRLADLAVPGISTGEIDHAAARFMREAGVQSAFLGYKKFPGNICISINEEVVHGIGGPRKIRYGDVVKMDVGIVRDGWIGDTAMSVPVGIIDPETERLSDGDGANSG